jgi:hypothetical protein
VISDSSNCRFRFQKRSQLFIDVRNETPSIVAMRVSNPDRSPVNQSLRHSPHFKPALLRLSAMIDLPEY